MALTISGSGGGLPLGSITYETGTYIGDGLTGADNPKSITFSKRPDFFFLFCNSGSASVYLTRVVCSVIGETFPSITSNTVSGTMIYSGSSASASFRCKIVGNTLSWLIRGTGYTDYTATNQTDYEYLWVALYLN